MGVKLGTSYVWTNPNSCSSDNIRQLVDFDSVEWHYPLEHLENLVLEKLYYMDKTLLKYSLCLYFKKQPHI